MSLALKSDFLSFIVVEHIQSFHGALQLSPTAASSSLEGNPEWWHSGTS